MKQCLVKYFEKKIKTLPLKSVLTERSFRESLEVKGKFPAHDSVAGSLTLSSSHVANLSVQNYWQDICSIAQVSLSICLFLS
jgi:hypothetical protein